MDFLNMAKGKYAGGDSMGKNKKSESIFDKALDAAEKYHVKEKASEFAQKRVAKREPDKHKDKSSLDKAVEAAEDFLVKQGQTKPHHSATNKKDNQMDDYLDKAMGFLSKK